MPPASYSLVLEGDLGLGGFVFKGGYPFLHNEGGGVFGGNTALGIDALISSGAYGHSNSAFGQDALRNTSGGHSNTAVGRDALRANQGGSGNTAVGKEALYSDTTGSSNVAVGAEAMYDSDGGFFNTAVGAKAGQYWTYGYDNVALGSGAYGVAGESKTIRIGGSNIQDTTFIEGIRGASSGHVGGFDQDVCIDADDQLGPCSESSARFKRDIEPLADMHEALASLRPVSFRYRVEQVGDGESALRFGLIAEEVANVIPSLVTTDRQGRPNTVRYDLLTPLLLQELRRQDRAIEELQARVSARDRTMSRLTQELERLAGTGPSEDTEPQQAQGRK